MKVSKIAASVALSAFVFSAYVPTTVNAAISIRSEQKTTTSPTRLFDHEWWIEKVIMPIIITILLKYIELNHNALTKKVNDALGWAKGFVKQWMIDEAAKRTCELVTQGYAESIARTNLGPYASEKEIKEAVRKITTNCAGGSDLLYII